MTPAGAAAPPSTRAGRIDLAQLFFNGAGRIGRAVFFAAFAAVAALWRVWFELPGAWLHRVFDLPVEIVLLASACTVLSKRLHDLSRAGWWSAVPVGLLAVVLAGDGPLNALQTLAGVLVLAVLLTLMAWPGERRFNRFGPSPREVRSTR